MTSYRVLIEPVEYQQEIKKSKFITYLAKTDTLKNARSYWQQIKQLHPTARHHCWAAVAGAPNNSLLYGLSDDGEPSGTAGKPMLNCLAGGKIGEISAVVVRYFGGTLLGTGGLIKAYSSSVQQAILLAKTIEKIPQIDCLLICDYAQANKLAYILEQYQAGIHQKLYLDKVQIYCSIHPNSFTKLQRIIQDNSAGQASFGKLLKP